MWSQCEGSERCDRNVWQNCFREGRSHYKKTGIILGIVLAVTFLAGNVLGASSSPDSHIDNLTEEYGSWHVGYFDANYVFKQTLLKDDRVTDVVSFDNVGYTTLSCIQATNKPYLCIAGFHKETEYFCGRSNHCDSRNSDMKSGLKERSLNYLKQSHCVN